MSFSGFDLESIQSLDNLTMDEVQRELDDQRLGNEALLAKLHSDQKKFLRVVKHEEKKKQNFQRQMEICVLMNANGLSIDAAQTTKKLLQEHRSLLEWNEQEAIQHQIRKDTLWKGVQMNMALLGEVNTLNQQIDTYHFLIAKKNRRMILDGIEENVDDDEKDAEEIVVNKVNNNDGAVKKDQDQEERKYIYQSPNHPSHKANLVNTSPTDLRAEYAQQLVAKNKRYHDVMKLLRGKVDELRECRKKMIDE